MEQTNRRRTLIVNRPYQKHIVYRLLWPSAVVVMFAGLLTIVFCVQLAQEADAVDVPLPTLVPFLIAAASFTICGTALMGLNALRLSHRIAGPMYRIKRTLEAGQPAPWRRAAGPGDRSQRVPRLARAASADRRAAEGAGDRRRAGQRARAAGVSRLTRMRSAPSWPIRHWR
jgi:hypothetical protein